MDQCTAGTDPVESDLTENNFYVLVDTSFNMGQQYALLKRISMASQAALGKVLPADGGDDPSHLFSTVEATLGVPCPILNSSIQKRHGHSGESTMKAERIACILENSEGAGPVQPREVSSRGYITNIYKHLNEG